MIIDLTDSATIDSITACLTEEATMQSFITLRFNTTKQYLEKCLRFQYSNNNLELVLSKSKTAPLFVYSVFKTTDGNYLYIERKLNETTVSIYDGNVLLFSRKYYLQFNIDAGWGVDSFNARVVSRKFSIAVSGYVSVNDHMGACIYVI